MAFPTIEKDTGGWDDFDRRLEAVRLATRLHQGTNSAGSQVVASAKSIEDYLKGED